MQLSTQNYHYYYYCYYYFIIIITIIIIAIALCLLFFSLAKWLLEQSGAASTGKWERRAQGAGGREEEANLCLAHPALTLVLSEGRGPSASPGCSFWERLGKCT